MTASTEPLRTAGRWPARGRKRRQRAILLCLLLAVTLPQPDGRGEEARNADTFLGRRGAEREATFRRLVATISSYRYVSPEGLERLDTTWARELAKAHARFAAARSVESAYYALVSLANSAHDYHSRLLRLPDSLDPPARGVTIEGLELRAEYDRDRQAADFVVTSDGIAGLPEGSVLEAVDSHPVGALRRDFYQWFSRGSSPYWLDQEFALWLTRRWSKRGPTPRPGTRQVFEFRNGSETIRRELRWTEVSQKEPDRSRRHPICASLSDLPDLGTGFTLRFTGLNYFILTPERHERTALVRVLSFAYPDRLDCFEKKLKNSDIEPRRPTAQDRPQGPPDWRELDHQALVHELRSLQMDGQVDRIVFDLRHTGGGLFHPGLIGQFTASGYSIGSKSFHYARAFSDPDEDWAVLTRRDAVLGMGPVPVAAGGYSPRGVGIARPVRYLRRLKRADPDLSFSPPIPFFCRRDCRPSEARYRGVEKPLGPVTLILGPRCASACDQFASLFVDNGLAASIGLPTAGASAPYRASIPLRLADDTTVRLEVTVGVDYRPNSQKTLEGHGVDPQLLLLPGEANRAQGYLNAALERIHARGRLRPGQYAAGSS